MSDVTELERDLRSALRARADAVVIGERDFDPEIGLAFGPVLTHDESDAGGHEDHSLRYVWTVLAAAAVVVVISVGTIWIGSSGGSKTVGVGATSTTTSVTTPTTDASGTVPHIVGSQPAPPNLVAQLAVPAAVLNSVGAGSVHQMPVALSPPVLMKDGKPRIVWVGADWCPFCAAQRWPLIVALSRFGTFVDLRVTSSTRYTVGGQPEVFPNTQTFSFHGATYSSPYIVFDALETQSNVLTNPSADLGVDFTKLETPPPDVQALIDQFDGPPYLRNAGAMPFVDLANRFLLAGSSYDVAVLQGKSSDEIATALSDPSSDTAQAVDGAANVMTAAICRLTENQPAGVCNAPSITAIGQQFELSR